MRIVVKTLTSYKQKTSVWKKKKKSQIRLVFVSIKEFYPRPTDINPTK